MFYVSIITIFFKSTLCIEPGKRMNIKKLILLFKGWCAKCEGMPEVNAKICENPGGDIKALSAHLERCVSMELLHHHIQQLTQHSSWELSKQDSFYVVFTHLCSCLIVIQESWLSWSSPATALTPCMVGLSCIGKAPWQWTVEMIMMTFA